MKNIISTLFLIMLFFGSAQANLVISTVYDGPLSGGVPKGVELYATDDIADLSIYALASANNGGGIDTIEFTFPAVAVAKGTYLYVASDSTGFNDFFGFFPNYRTSAMSINGDDTVLLFTNGTISDVFGDINVDGNGTAWEYLDGWASRVAGSGPDGSTFNIANWTFSGPNALDGESSNATAASPVPFGIYGGVPADVQIAVSSNVFTPADTTISVGQTVEWTNMGGFHNVNGSTATYPSNPEGFANGPASTDAWTFSHTFTIAGVYDYQCDPHVGLGMIGKITVIAPPPSYDIATVTTVNMDGEPDSLGVVCQLTGVVHGNDFNGGGSISFTLIDGTGGLNIFSSNDFGYTVAEGDQIIVQGTISAFNGLSQISPDTLWMVSTGNSLVNAAVVTALDESTESELVRINGLSLVDPSQWTSSGSGFNVDVTDGTNTYTMRVDRDVDLYNEAAPTGDFDAMGLGGQFDNSSPFTSGYQFLPRYVADIMPIAPVVLDAVDDNANTEENTDVIISVLQNDAAPNGIDTLYIAQMPNQGMAAVNMDNTITYTPNLDTCGVDFFLYTICDNTGCDTARVDITINCPSAYPIYPIGLISSVDVNGEADSLGVICEIRGIVYGVNNRPGGLQFTIIDQNDAEDGIGLFSGGDNFGYTVTEGDEVAIRGTIAFFNGLTQINPDTVILLSQGNAIFDPQVITVLEESSESKLVRINGLSIVDPSQWTNSGSGFNVDVTDGTSTFTMRIDADVDIYGTPVPTSDFDLVGLGGQFDNSSPYDAGYQLLPRYMADIIPIIPAMITTIDDNATTEINTAVSIDVLANDLLPFAFDTLIIITPPSIGTAAVNMMDTTITYTPNMDECGSDSFTYAVCDITNACDTSTVSITVNCPVSYPLYPIGLVSSVDANGEPDSLDVSCEIRGIVYGVNLRAGGLQFTIIDENNADDGISLFSFDENFGYTVAEGDEVAIQGSISFFNGLTQISPDSVWMLSAGNSLFDPEVVTALGENTESKLVTINGLTIVDPTEWTNSGSGFNVTVTDGTNNYAMRIDNDVDIYGTTPPTMPFNLTGLGGQFDNSSPYDEGYQLLPRYLSDIDVETAIVDPVLGDKIQVFPNPANDWLSVNLDIPVKRIQMLNVFGQLILEMDQPEESTRIDLSDVPAGIYLLTFYGEDGIWTTEVVRQ